MLSVFRVYQFIALYIIVTLVDNMILFKFFRAELRYKFRYFGIRIDFKWIENAIELINRNVF